MRGIASSPTKSLAGGATADYCFSALFHRPLGEERRAGAVIPAEPCCRAWLAKGPAARPRKCAAGTATRCPAHGCDAATALGRAAFLITIAIGGVLSAVALLKGRLWLGVLGLLFPLLALIGTLRLARPNSPWAPRRSRPGAR